MHLTIFGTGYVGLVTGSCLADVGHRVLCVDVDVRKVEALKRGEIPIYEPGLEGLIQKNVASGRLSFTSDAAAAVEFSGVQFIAVGTPPDESGAADLKHVLEVAAAIGGHCRSPKVVVVKSTVPVGTSDRVLERITQVMAERGAAFPVDVCSNPEFLKEGSAVGDFQKPDRIIVGVSSERAAEAMREIYEPFNRSHDRTIMMDVRSAELTKYAANAMLATKISFINEMANLAERLGADIEQVRKGIGADRRIGYDFIYPGAGYGGSCFPKDVQALARTASDIGYDAELIRAVESVNGRQKRAMFRKLAQYFGGTDALHGRVVGLWGLAFKPNTDDMREAPSRALMEALWQAGATVRAFDPVAGDEARRLYGQRPDLTIVADQYEAAEGVDALAIVTEWLQFRAPDFDELKTRMKGQVIVDGRNLYHPERLRAAGWTYLSIGRPDAAR